MLLACAEYERSSPSRSPSRSMRVSTGGQSPMHQNTSAEARPGSKGIAPLVFPLVESLPLLQPFPQLILVHTPHPVHSPANPNLYIPACRLNHEPNPSVVPSLSYRFARRRSRKRPHPRQCPDFTSAKRGLTPLPPPCRPGPVSPEAFALKCLLPRRQRRWPPPRHRLGPEVTAGKARITDLCHGRPGRTMESPPSGSHPGTPALAYNLRYHVGYPVYIPAFHAVMRHHPARPLPDDLYLDTSFEELARHESRGHA